MGYVRRVETDVASDLRCPLSHLDQIWHVSIKFIISVACKPPWKFLPLFSIYLLADRQAYKPWRNQKSVFLLQFFIPNSPKMGLKCGLERIINPLYWKSGRAFFHGHWNNAWRGRQVSRIFNCLFSADLIVLETLRFALSRRRMTGSSEFYLEFLIITLFLSPFQLLAIILGL
jgi:hypothetical protein